MAWHGKRFAMLCLDTLSFVHDVCLHPCDYSSLSYSPEASSCYACSFYAIFFFDALMTNPAIVIPIRSNALATLGMDHVATVPD